MKLLLVVGLNVLRWEGIVAPGDWDNIILNAIFRGRDRGEIILRYSQILPFRMSVAQTNSQMYTCQTL